MSQQVTLQGSLPHPELFELHLKHWHTLGIVHLDGELPTDWARFQRDAARGKLVISSTVPSADFCRSVDSSFFRLPLNLSKLKKDLRRLRSLIYSSSPKAISKFEQRTFARQEGTFSQPLYGVFPETEHPQQIIVLRRVDYSHLANEMPGTNEAVICGLSGEFMLVNRSGALSIRTKNPLLRALWRIAKNEPDNHARFARFADLVKNSVYAEEYLGMPKSSDAPDYLVISRLLIQSGNTLYVKDAYGGAGNEVARIRSGDGGMPILESHSPQILELALPRHDRSTPNAEEPAIQPGPALGDPEIVMPAVLKSMRLPIIESQIPYEVVNGCRVEFRVICGIEGVNDWIVFGHYAKVSNKEVTANISHGGWGNRTEVVVLQIYKQRIPGLSADELERRTIDFVQKIERDSLTFARRFYDHFKDRAQPDIAIDICPSWNSELGEIELYLVEVNQNNYGISGLISCNPEVASKVRELRLSEGLAPPLFMRDAAFLQDSVVNLPNGTVGAIGGGGPDNLMVLGLLPGTLEQNPRPKGTFGISINGATCEQNRRLALGRIEINLRASRAPAISRSEIFKGLDLHGWLRIPRTFTVSLMKNRTPAIVYYDRVEGTDPAVFSAAIDHLRRGGKVSLGIPYREALLKVEGGVLNLDSDDLDILSAWSEAADLDGQWDAKFQFLVSNYFSNPVNHRDFVLCSGSETEAATSDLRNCALLVRQLQSHQSPVFVRGLFDFADRNTFRVLSGRGPLDGRLSVSSRHSCACAETAAPGPILQALRSSERAAIQTNPRLVAALRSFSSCLIQESVDGTDIGGYEYQFEVYFSDSNEINRVSVGRRKAHSMNSFSSVADTETTVEGIYTLMFGAALKESEARSLATRSVREIRREALDFVRWYARTFPARISYTEDTLGRKIRYESLRMLAFWDVGRCRLGFVFNDLVPNLWREINRESERGDRLWRDHWSSYE